MSGLADRGGLEAERDFLLRSLADLDDERDRGELVVEQYEALPATYTARAAAILRTLERNTPAAPAETATRPERRTSSRALPVAVALTAVLGVGALVLPGALKDRQPGDTVTGNAQPTGPAGDSLAAAVQRNPNEPQARLAYARYLLDQGNLVDAVRQFDAVRRLDPTNAEALAYSGWIIALAGVTDAGMERLDAAVAADPDYPDAHLFRGMTLLDTGRPADAVAELERYLELAPGTPQRAQIEALLDQARQQTTPNPP
ncbi:MAG: tetratricopeptide repeat protein [Acidimicrobiales bacterium]